MNSSCNIWIGTIGVVPKPGNSILGKAIGAYVNFLTFARDERHFLDKVYKCLAELGLDLFESEKPELYYVRNKEFPMDEEINALAEVLEKTGESQFSTFHTFNDI